MKNGEILLTGTTQELVSQMHGKVYQTVIPPQELHMWESEPSIQIVNLRNEADGSICLRYLGNPTDIPDAEAQNPTLEDLYLHLFPRT